MKRIILIVVLALFSTLAFAACGAGDKKPEDDNKEIVQPTDDKTDETGDETDDKTGDETGDNEGDPSGTDGENKSNPVTPIGDGGDFKAN